MRELDLLLEYYLEHAFATAAPEEREAFIELLGLDNAALQTYLMAERVPPNENLAAVVRKISGLNARRAEDGC